MTTSAAQENTEIEPSTVAQPPPQVSYLHLPGKWAKPESHVLQELEAAHAVLQGRGLDEQDEHGRTALHLAASEGYAKVVKFLLAKSRFAALQTRSSSSVALERSDSHGGEAVVDAVVPLSQMQQSGGFTPLHVAVAHYKLSVVEALLTERVPINAMDRFGDTPLHTAVRASNDLALRLLLDHGADILLKDNKGESAYHVAQKIFLPSKAEKKGGSPLDILQSHLGQCYRNAALLKPVLALNALSLMGCESVMIHPLLMTLLTLTMVKTKGALSWTMVFEGPP
jgi:hypothetical protein